MVSKSSLLQRVDVDFFKRAIDDINRIVEEYGGDRVTSRKITSLIVKHIRFKEIKEDIIKKILEEQKIGVER